MAPSSGWMAVFRSDSDRGTRSADLEGDRPTTPRRSVLLGAYDKPLRCAERNASLGVVLDDAFYIYTESGTRKARNLRANSRVIVHLESAEDVLIVHGHLDYLGHPSAHQEVVSAFARKYDRPEEAPFLPSAPFFDMLYALQPLHAMAWSLPDTEASTRRWRAGRDGPAGDVSGSPAPSSHTDAAGAN